MSGSKFEELIGVFSNGQRKSVGDVEEKKDVSHEQILIVQSPAFFAERKSDGKLQSMVFHENPFSKLLFEAVAQKYHYIVALYTHEETRLWIENGCEKNHQVKYVQVNVESIADSTRNLVDLLRHELGVRLSLPRNMREVSWTNVIRFVRDPVGRVSEVRETDHHKIGLTTPKEKTFEDLASERKRGGWM